jgi:hypothetical protein
MRHVSPVRRTAAGTLAGLTLALTLGSAGLLAQAGAVSRTPTTAGQTVVLNQPLPAGPSAEQIREEFTEVLKRYPPQVAQILKLDPTLLTREDYLTPYPAIGAYLAQHPEVRRSPEYFLARFNSGYSSYVYDARARAWDQMMEMFSIVAVAGTFVFGFAWLIRNALDYRRWGRQAKVQAEAHTKLLDRLTSNDELLSYVQSPAGSRFLQSAPITLDGKPKAMGAPFSRILWSMQAGVVLAAAGIGLNYVSRRVHPDSADPVFTMSVILLSVGLGFFASAGLSFLLSKRLGLLGGGNAHDADSQG